MQDISPLARERQLLVQHIWTYQSRRKALKEKYGEESEIYKERSHRISMAIHNYKKKIGRIDEASSKILALDKRVEEFLGFSPKKRGRKGNDIARKLFFKWGMENGISGRWLKNYVGIKRINTPSRIRMRFTKSFTTHPQNKELWYRFKEFMKEPSNQLG